jgi:hypothetical protein
MDGARRKFANHKCRAVSSGIGWQLTFEEWCEIWRKSGQWENRGPKRGQYVMARNWDAGPYAVWNVDIQLSCDNLRTIVYRRQYKRAKVPAEGLMPEVPEWCADPLRILEAQEERACNQD